MIFGQVGRAWVLASLTACCAFAQPQAQIGSIGDLKLENGAVIKDCRIGYRTFGALNAQRSNAVLFPTWFTGTTKELIGQIGPGKIVDPSRYYVVAMDALGDGISSSPSNSTTQSRMRFPEFSIRDMVEAEHALATRVLGLSHVHAVVGISMGGMQTFEWMVAYPDFMDRAIPIVGSPKLGAYDLLLWQTELRAIEEDPAWKHGDYQTRPEAAMRTVGDIHALALETPQRRSRDTKPAQFDKLLAETEKEAKEGFDANDWYRQAQAMMRQDVSKRFGGDMQKAAQAVHARVLVIAAVQDHMVTPYTALEFARLAKARTLELQSDCGHLAPGCELPKVSAAIAQFLAE
ncbi:MAG: alpha/beta fold hydrolase [Bryobacteraceae bacterium]